MATVQFSLRQNPAHPGTETIFANRGEGWKPVRLGKFSESENASQVARLEKRGIRVQRRA